MANSRHHQVLIVGGGTAGITVAASLHRRGGLGIDLAIVEPSDVHYYQPAFTLVGGGAYGLEDTRRDEATLIPRGVTWLRTAVSAIDPDKNAVSLNSGGGLTYDYLVVCPGLGLNWEQVEGLKDALGRNGVCSNHCRRSWRGC